jgi:drug/metabolite transporter (DMT)-like permease
MGVFFGLFAAICWGTGDFLARYATHRIGTYRTLCYIQFVGIAGLSVYLLATGELQHAFSSTSWLIWVWAGVAVLLNIIASLTLYRAFEVGTLSLVSPIAASYAVVTISLSFMSGETLTIWQCVAIVLVLLGVIVVSTPLRNADGDRAGFTPPWKGGVHGVRWALLAACGYGLTFWILGHFVTPSLGGITPVWCIRLATPLILFVLSPAARQPLTFPRGSIWWILLGVGIVDTFGYIFYNNGTLSGALALVTILSSLYSAVTVLLAWIFLRERLQYSQWLGIGVIFVGIVLINL